MKDKNKTNEIVKLLTAIVVLITAIIGLITLLNKNKPQSQENSSSNPQIIIQQDSSVVKPKENQQLIDDKTDEPEKPKVKKNEKEINEIQNDKNNNYRNEKSTIVHSVEQSESKNNYEFPSKSRTEEILDTKIPVKIILNRKSRIDEIDGKDIGGLPKNRIVNLTEGKHTFKIISEGYSCLKTIVISNSTEYITLSCN